MTNRPGFPGLFLSLWQVSANWWWPWWNNADTYSSHFQKAYFGDTVLADTALAPQLIVNATDIENTSPARAREVFFKGRSDYPELDRTPINEVVAASAAFPGAFQPKTIIWPSGVGKNSAPATRRFVDGGVVENLGYRGWERFVDVETKLNPNEPPPKPDFLIVSDASAEIEGGTLPVKIDLIDLLSRSADITFGTQITLLKEHIKRTKPQTEFVRAQDEDSLNKLAATCFTSYAGRCVETGDQVAGQVGRFPTLRELEPDEVVRAFWVGRTLGDIQWNKIDQWRTEMTKQQQSCPDYGAEP